MSTFSRRHPLLSLLSTVVWAVAVVLVAIWIVSVAWAFKALAAECPPNPPGTPPGCKVLTLSPQEEAILVQERGILATAAEGRKIELEAATMYFRQRIQSAPPGEVKQEPPK